MTETVFGVLAMILSVVGAVSIIRWIALKLVVSDKAGGRVYAVLLREEPDIQLQMLMSTLEWDSTLNGAKIYAIDGGLDDVMSEYCSAVCSGSRITYVSAAEAEKFMEIF